MKLCATFEFHQESNRPINRLFSAIYVCKPGCFVVICECFDTVFGNVVHGTISIFLYFLHFRFR